MCKAVALVLGACFAFITVGTTLHLLRPEDFTSHYRGVVPFNLAIALVCMALVLALTKATDWLDKRGRVAQNAFAIVLFVLMGALTLHVAFGVCPRPDTDSFDCIDAAAYLLKNGEMDDGFTHVASIGRYANNRLIILVFKGLLALFPGLDTYGFLHVCYGINTACILVAVGLTYATVRSCRGVAAANRVLALCALNPLYYGLVCWVYSLTFSLPIMMGALYVGLRVYRANGTLTAALWAALEGVLMVLGYEIRPTACFVVVALALVAIGARMWRGKGAQTQSMGDKGMATKKLAVVAVVALVVCVACEGLCSRAKARYFSQMEGRGFPVTYWLSMGSHDTGTLSTNKPDRELVQSLEPSDRFMGMLNRTLQNYGSNGIAGTLGLWAQKTAQTWSNGDSGVWKRMTSNEAGGSVAYELLGGDHRDLYITYGHAFRLLTNIGIVLACLEVVRKKPANASLLSLTLMLTLLIGIAFYCVWEAKSVYSAPFALTMIVLAAEGWGYVARLLRDAEARRQQVARRVGLAALAVALVCSAVPLYGYATTPQRLRYYHIRSIVNKRVWSGLEFKDEVRQEFFANGPFNRLALKVLQNDVGVAGARYAATLRNEEGRAVHSWEFGPNDAKRSEVVLSLDAAETPAEGGWYELVILHAGEGQSQISLMTGNATYCDSYRGARFVDSVRDDANDLKMDVRYEVEEPMLPISSSSV